LADTKISALGAITDPQTDDELAINNAGSSAKITFENLTKRNILVPCTLEVPQGAIAFPDIHTLTTAVAKISGIVLPDGAASSTLNFKCVIPEDLHTTPAMACRIRFMTQTADTAHAVRLVVATLGYGVNENIDIAISGGAETEVTAECADTTETMNEAEILIDLGTDWAAGDTVIGQLTRDPTDAVDDFAGDILVVGIELMMDVVGSA